MMLRTILTNGVGAAALVAASLAFGAPAGADEKTERWKMGSTFPGQLVQLGSLGISLTKKVDEISDGKFKIRFYEPGALAPALEYFDAIAKGSIDAAWSTPGYWYGKEKSLALFAAVPFGPSAGEYLAWIYYGGGETMMNEIYHKHGIHSLICGIIAPEASGWFRSEIKSVDDLKGLKMRFFGLGAKVMQKLGVSTQLLAAGDIYPALERGTIDATEFSMPAIDLRLGFHQVAKHYYFPGWHQQATLFELMMNKRKYDALSKAKKAQLRVACGDNIREGLAEGEAIQGAALEELKAKGVQLHRWSPEILAAIEKAWDEVADEEAKSDPNFAKVWASLKTFRAKYAVWRDLGYVK
jgi:TRAP-type mannitol/chloroaromatic compound transport system substrate-binding protein